MTSRTVALAIAAGLLAAGCSSSLNEAAPVAGKPAPAPVVEAPTPTEPAPAPVPSAETKVPTETPEAGRIAALVEQLGSPDYEKREAATKELAGIGKPALPALEKASKDPDAERASRARDLAVRLSASDEEAKAPEIPGLAEAVRSGMGGTSVVIGGNGAGMQAGMKLNVQVVGAGGAGNVRTRVEMVNGESRRTVENDHGSATVAEGKGGLSLTLAPKGGEAMTFSAPSREEFKKKYPKLYAKDFGG